ncbi:hypothetical protein [Novispirillum itersonii]|uniref:hypothetical protein n=1 Tax=Novispirillum itersonii TaxID=189 RepID=UPI0012DD3FA3|nr:hypothetical protein [Novispirillum itersonii]
MSSSTGILLPQTLERYHAAHQDLAGHLVRRKAALAALRPSLVVASASYSAIAAAADLGVPAVTVGPFLWHDIVQAYAPGADTLLSEMAELYQRATGFVLTTPFVAPTVAGPARHVVGPVGLVGQCRRADLLKTGVIRQGERIVFASLGGVGEDVPYSGWRCPAGWRLLTQEDARRHGLRIGDLIASSAAVVTKPGYGTYVEAAHAGASLISRARPDWPESAGLLGWYRQQGLPVYEVSEESFAGFGPLSVLSNSPDIGDAGTSAGQRFTPGAEQCADLLIGQYL